MKPSFFLLLLALTHQSHPVVSATQENVPAQRVDHLKTRQTNSSSSATSTTTTTTTSLPTTGDEFIINVVTDNPSTDSSANVNETANSKSSQQVLGFGLPDFSALSRPFLPPMPCISASGRPGTCNADATCGGTAHPDGLCALSLGTCCSNFITCSQFSLSNVSVFASPGYPVPLQTGQLCELTINKYLLAEQMRIDFIDLELLPADTSTGLCLDDSLEISGLTGLKLPRICGTGTGQHLYIPLTLAVFQIKLKFVLSSKPFARKFKIQVTQFEKNHWNSAPFGCLQYYAQPAGTVSSLVLEKTPNGEVSYSICFKNFNDVCGIKLLPVSSRPARSLLLPDLVKSSVPEYGYSLMKSADVYSHMSSIAKPLLPQPKSHDHEAQSYVPSKGYKSYPLVHESPNGPSYIAPLPLPLAIPSADKFKSLKGDLLQDLIEKKLLILQSLLLDLHNLGASEIIAKALGVPSLQALSPSDVSIKDKLATGSPVKYHSSYTAYPGSAKGLTRPLYAGSFRKAPKTHRASHGRVYGVKQSKHPLLTHYNEAGPYQYKGYSEEKKKLEEVLAIKSLVSKPLLQLGLPMIPGYPLLKSTTVQLEPLVPLKPQYHLGMPMIPGFPLVKSPPVDLKPLLEPGLKTLPLPSLKPIQVPALLPVSPIALNPLNMTGWISCQGRSSITHAQGILCSDHLEQVSLTTAPFMLHVTVRNDGRPFNFAFSFSRQACSPTVL